MNTMPWERWQGSQPSANKRGIQEAISHPEIFTALQTFLTHDSRRGKFEMLEPEQVLRSTPETTAMLIAIIKCIKETTQESWQRAVASLFIVLDTFTRDERPVAYAAIHIALALAYSSHREGDRRQNLALALDHCQRALEIYTLTAFPLEWAIAHVTLGYIYTLLDQVSDPRLNTIERALEHYEQAEPLCIEEHFPVYWAMVQQGLLVVFLTRRNDHKEQNLQLAITRGESALRVLTRTAQPFEWASVHTYLGESYRQATLYADLRALYSGRAVMQEQAIRHLEAALQVYTQQDYPLEWSRAQRFYGMAYMERVKGQHHENLAWARHCFESILHVCNRSFSPPDWAATQVLLGTTFLSSHNDHKESIERAITHFQAALNTCMFTEYPFQWATIQAHLCRAYTMRIAGQRRQNAEQAIQYGQAACRIYTQYETPFEWAETHMYLGTAYLQRVNGERKVNVEQAIACYKQAMLVYTYERAPFRWALIQFNLSTAYRERLAGDPDENAALATQYAQQALAVYAEKKALDEWARLQVHLASTYRCFLPKSSHEQVSKASIHSYVDPLYWDGLRVVRW